MLGFATVVSAGQVEDLVQLPANFITRQMEKNFIVVRLELSDGRQRRMGRFFFDSGAYRSMLFSSSTSDEPHPYSLKTGKVPLGRTNFYALSLRELPPLMRSFCQKRRIDGILGTNYFRSHDILVDYAQKRLYTTWTIPQNMGIPKRIKTFSPTRLPEKFRATLLSTLSHKPIPLTDWNDRFVCHAEIPETGATFFPIVDTGASLISVPQLCFPRLPAQHSVSINQGRFVIGGSNHRFRLAIDGRQGKLVNGFVSTDTLPVLPARSISERLWISAAQKQMLDLSHSRLTQTGRVTLRVRPRLEQEQASPIDPVPEGEKYFPIMIAFTKKDGESAHTTVYPWTKTLPQILVISYR